MTAAVFFLIAATVMLGWNLCAAIIGKLPPTGYSAVCAAVVVFCLVMGVAMMGASA